jgi:hypothetical protein
MSCSTVLHETGDGETVADMPHVGSGFPRDTCAAQELAKLHDGRQGRERHQGGGAQEQPCDLTLWAVVTGLYDGRLPACVRRVLCGGPSAGTGHRGSTCPITIALCHFVPYASLMPASQGAPSALPADRCEARRVPDARATL